MNHLHSPVVWLRWIASNAKRLLVFLLGATLVGAGIVMLVLPGPGILVSIAGLALLATEFAWAERALDRSKAGAIDATTKMSANRANRIALGATAIGLTVGGAAATTLSPPHRALGLGILVAGLSASAVLLPQTQRWLNSHVQKHPITPDPATPLSERTHPS